MRQQYRSKVPERIRQPMFLLRRQFNLAYGLLRRRGVHVFDDRVRNMTVNMGGLKGAYAGQRCVLMGNGPSLNRMDLDLFKNEQVWGSNKCYLLFDRIQWRPNFYVAVDSRVVPDIRLEINQLIETMPKSRFFFPVKYREWGILRSGPAVYWYRESSDVESIEPENRFTRDASAWVSNVNTVTVAALQLAAYLGFNPIYLIGCDTSYIVPDTVQHEGGKSFRLVSTADDDPNHFASNYFGAGSKWHPPRPENMIQNYEQAKVICDQLGIQVFDATVGGKLDVFPKVDYSTVFASSPADQI
jgi:hypothetical protein